MKVGNAVIRKKAIEISTPDQFYAEYKGRKISITTDHGYGKPCVPGFKRFLIDVTDIKTGMLDVDTYGDFQTIDQAIFYALEGAMLLPTNTN